MHDLFATPNADPTFLIHVLPEEIQMHSLKDLSKLRETLFFI